MTEPIDPTDDWVGLSGAIDMVQERLHVGRHAARVAVHRAGKRGKIRTISLGSKATIYSIDDLTEYIAGRAGG